MRLVQDSCMWTQRTPNPGMFSHALCDFLSCGPKEGSSPRSREDQKRKRGGKGLRRCGRAEHAAPPAPGGTHMGHHHALGVAGSRQRALRVPTLGSTGFSPVLPGGVGENRSHAQFHLEVQEVIPGELEKQVLGTGRERPCRRQERDSA